MDTEPTGPKKVYNAVTTELLEDLPLGVYVITFRSREPERPVAPVKGYQGYMKRANRRRY